MSETLKLTLEHPAQTHTKPVKRLTDADKAFALRYHADGLTQVQIAHRLNCDQATISRWLSQCQDTTVEAGAYFRGQALGMAQKVRHKGTASDLIKALQGVSVLQAEQAGGLTIIVGGAAQVQVNVGLSPPQITSVGEGEKNR